jgi:hypothetical protein
LMHLNTAASLSSAMYLPTSFKLKKRDWVCGQRRADAHWGPCARRTCTSQADQLVIVRDDAQTLNAHDGLWPERRQAAVSLQKAALPSQPLQRAHPTQHQQGRDCRAPRAPR